MDQSPKKIQNDMLTQAHKDFEKVLIKSAFIKVHNKSLSEDLVQETFLKTWKYIIRGGEITSVKAFLYHILNALIIDQYRKEKKESYSLDLLQEGGFDVSTNEHVHAGESIDVQTAASYIRELPTKYRDVVYMKVILEMPLDDIAYKTNSNKQTVSVQIHRGLKRIQSMHETKSLKKSNDLCN